MENEGNILPGSKNFNEKDEGIKETFSIPVIQEQVTIEKKFIETGKIRIKKNVSEDNQLFNIPLIHDEIEIKRIPVNEYVEILPEPVRYQGDTMIIPVLKEVATVRIMLVEEIHVVKKRIEQQEEQNVVLRKEDVTIENIAPGNHEDIK